MSVNVREKKRYYPLCLDVQGKRCVVVGGGTVAERKVRSLLACGARVCVVSPGLVRGLSLLAAKKRIERRDGFYRKDDLKGAGLVIAATGDAQLNAAVARDAAKLRVPVNVVDAPLLSSFIVPAVLSRGQITVSVSTNGTSPFLARRIKETIARLLGPEYAEYGRLCAGARRRARRRYRRPEVRAAIYKRIEASPALALLKVGRRHEAALIVQRIVDGGERDD